MPATISHFERGGDIEADLYRADVHPNAVIGSLMSFAVRFGVVPVLADDHETAARLTERLLMNFARVVGRDYKALRQGADLPPVADTG